MARSRRESRPIDIWPGFVDALSTLLMVIIFLLVVFVLGQFFLSQVLQQRENAVKGLEGSVSDLASRLTSEKDTAAELRRNLQRLTADLQSLMADRDELTGQLAKSESDRQAVADRLSLAESERSQLSQTLQAMQVERQRDSQSTGSTRTELEEARQLVAADREKLEVQLAQLVQLRRDIDSLTKVRTDLEGKVAEQVALLDAARKEGADATQKVTDLEATRQQLLAELGQTRDRSANLEAELADAQNKTMLSQTELAARDVRIEELLRSAGTLEQTRNDSVAEVNLLNQQIAALAEQLQRLDAALDLKQQSIDLQGRTIADLGQRLNLALASKVEELSQYRSDFFGRLRRVLGNRDDVRVVGDRFVFQSELLFSSGEAELSERGKDELLKFADTFKQIAAQIPADLPWILRVDGHTDRRPIATARFPSNWELSTARAIAVARFLIDEGGLPKDRVAAAGFADNQPLDPADSDAAYERNRRIELKLTNL